MHAIENERSRPRKGSIAVCGIGCLGLITEDEPKEITYPDGSKGMAYVGIHLTDKVAPVGSPWSSRKPNVVGHISQFDPEARNGGGNAV